MKTLSILALFLLSYLAVPTFGKVPAQLVDINGKKWHVTSRRSLNPKTDYYLLQETADSPAKAYFKTEEGFTATEFSFSELQTYLASGDLTALGRVVEVPLADGQQVQYVEKGDVVVIVYKEPTKVYFTEYSGSINTLISQLSNPETSLQTCEDQCLARARACMAVGKNRVEYCTQRYAECIRVCDSSASAKTVNAYSIAN